MEKFLSQHSNDQYRDLKLQIQGLLKPGTQFKRNVLFDQLYDSMPRDPQARVQVYSAEIAPGGFTNYHCHNGPAFFLALQGIFEAHFEEGVLVKAKAGDVYFEPLAKIHRGHNPHKELPYLCVGFCVNSPDREPVTNVVQGW